MSIDLKGNTITNIFNTKENIEGILYQLKKIMNSDSYDLLKKEYDELKSQIPTETFLTEEEKKHPNISIDIKYTELKNKLNQFESKISAYNKFKVLKDTKKNIEKIINELNDKPETYTELVSEAKKLVDIIDDIKADTEMPLFSKFLDEVMDTLYKACKTLALIKNNEVVDYINKNSVDQSAYMPTKIENLIVNSLGNRIKKEIDTTEFSGNLSDDYIDFNVFTECALEDKELISLLGEPATLEERIKLREERIKREQEEFEENKANTIKSLNGRIENVKRSIASSKSKITGLRINKTLIAARKFILVGVPVVMLAAPIAIPIIGHNIGVKKSEEVMLTKTYTSMVDVDSGNVTPLAESYEELNTDYVASITICAPYKKNISGGSYTRTCVVYDYKVPKEVLESVDGDFHLSKEYIKEDYLTYKYDYTQTEAKIDSKYLEDIQILVTETYQDSNDLIPSDKYVARGICYGLAIAVLVAYGEGVLYFKVIRDLLDELNNNAYDKKNDIDRTIERINRDINDYRRQHDELTQEVEATKNKVYQLK